jgi:hypothetical protein
LPLVTPRAAVSVCCRDVGQALLLPLSDLHCKRAEAYFADVI